MNEIDLILYNLCIIIIVCIDLYYYDSVDKVLLFSFYFVINCCERSVGWQKFNVCFFCFFRFFGAK